MYESWFGFREKPFNLTPDPRYLYLSAKHAEAFAHLEFGRRERGGFILITGEVGTGKTTLARYFLSKLGPETRTAVVLYPALTAAELLRGILEDLHVEPRGDSLKGLIDALHRFLLDEHAAGRNVVLLIDEAQDLSAEVLEQIRLISNLETDSEKLIQIVLIGQSELRGLLARHELRQLAQRVTARYHLTPLSLPDVGEYVRHRLEVAGGAGKASFTRDALRTVHKLSRGTPRLLNLICDRALLAGFVQGSRTIDARMVRRAALEVAPDAAPAAPRWRHALVATTLTAGLAALVFGLAPRAARAPAAGAALPAQEATAVEDAAPARELLAFVRTADRAASFAEAVTRVDATWGGKEIERTPLRTHVAQLRAIDLPAVLELFHPARRDTCFVALLRLDTRQALIEGSTGLKQTVLLQTLNDLWTREAVIAWPRQDVAGQDETRLLDWARSALGAGAAEDLTPAVRRFQQENDLVSDGVLGPRTRLLLFARVSQERPRLSGGAL